MKRQCERDRNFEGNKQSRLEVTCWVMKRSVSECWCCIWREISSPRKENRGLEERIELWPFFICELLLNSLIRLCGVVEKLQVRPLSAALFVVVIPGRESAMGQV